jgi:hypothetical protein
LGLEKSEALADDIILGIHTSNLLGQFGNPRLETVILLHEQLHDLPLANASRLTALRISGLQPGPGCSDRGGGKTFILGMKLADHD